MVPSRPYLTDDTVRDTLGTGIYFMTYESSKQLLTTFGGDGTHSNPLAVLVAGGLCGIVSWAMICEQWRDTLPLVQGKHLTVSRRPNRFREKHLSAELSDVLQGPDCTPREDRILPEAYVQGAGRVHGSFLRRECCFLLFL
jgi:hypothetical protein